MKRNAEEVFWERFNEEKGIGEAAFYYNGIRYSAVGYYGISYTDKAGVEHNYWPYDTVEDLIDAKVLEDGLSMREILQRITEDDFDWQ